MIKGAAAPVVTIAEPTSNGTRGRTRSASLPALTALSVGSNPYSDISTPTVKGEA